MLTADYYKVCPIAWTMKSEILVNHLSSLISKESILIGDFAAGEHDRIPSFFVNLLPEFFPAFNPQNRRVVYCIDLHALRLDSLLGKLEDSKLLEDVRVVQAKLETMDKEAELRPGLIEFLDSNTETMTWFDHHLRTHSFIPPEVFDIGVLNNDVVGYLHEYYKEYSDVVVSLQKIHKTLKKGALLLVTMPCSLYVVNNVDILESVGFQFLDGKDINLKDSSVTKLDRNSDPISMSRLGHYSFLIFIRN